MTGARHQGHQIGDDRSQEREVLGVATQDAISEVDEVVHAAGHLHRRDGHDDGHDDRHDVERHLAGFQPEESQHEYAEPAGEADGDTAQSGSEEDCQQDDGELDGNHAVTPCSEAPIGTAFEPIRSSSIRVSFMDLPFSCPAREVGIAVTSSAMGPGPTARAVIRRAGGNSSCASIQSS